VVAQLSGTLKQLRDEFGLSVLLAAQDLPSALQTADRVALLQSGRQMLTDSAAALAQDPGHLHNIYFS
jgi:ABC-type branched-subunit amino acid transport system ATPase component